MNSRCRFRTACLLVAALSAPAGAIEPPPPRAPLTLDPLTLLVDWLGGLPGAERVRFATVALNELANSYERELLVAAGDPRDVRDPGRVLRWRAAAVQSVREARAVAATLLPHDAVRVFLDPGPSLRFIVHGRTIIVDAPRLVDGPRPGESAARGGLGERIVRRYCERVSCPQLLDPGAALASRAPPWAGWSFSGTQPAFVETGIGLGFSFDDRTDLAARKRDCETLVADLAAAAARLAWYRDRGALIEWDRFHLARDPVSNASVLVVNRYGDYMALAARGYQLPREPLLAWFRARLGGTHYEYVFERAGEIFDLPNDA